MPKRGKNEMVRIGHFSWRLRKRSNGLWQADGRSNKINVGRHSLGTADREEAITRLKELDAIIAVENGLASKSQPAEGAKLTLEAGRKLYENHLKRPREVGGVRPSTRKKYRAAFDKFLDFAAKNGLADWNSVTVRILTDYASNLKDRDYSGNTISKELVTLQQARKWLVREKHLAGEERLNLRIRKSEGQRAYCYTKEQVAAMVDHCRKTNSLVWLLHVIVALACTGLRIAELASLRWSDLDMSNQLLHLTDESGLAKGGAGSHRTTKSGRSRSLPIHPDLMQELKQIPRRDAFVFHGPRGGRLKPDTVRRVLIKQVIEPLLVRFPSVEGEQGFADGRLHSFRHYFASMCALNPELTERVTMHWLGHQDSAMVRHYFHLHNAESRRQMARLSPIGNTGLRLAEVRAAENEKETTSRAESESQAG